MQRIRVLAASLLALGVTSSAAAAPRDSAVERMDIADYRNLEQNLRWVLARERAAAEKSPARVAPRVVVFADAGAWHVGARSLVDALESDGILCRVLDGSALTAKGLEGAAGLVIPGGWASLEAEALGEAGSAAVRAFVQGGGRCIGICAGGFLLSRSISWEGKPYSYGLGLFDGSAEGPIASLAPWPSRAAVRLAVSEAGKKRGLSEAGEHDALYYGGPRFLGGTSVETLASYPDGTAAIVARGFGKGEVVLVGPHFERPAPAEGGDSAAAPVGTAALMRALLRLPK